MYKESKGNKMFILIKEIIWFIKTLLSIVVEVHDDTFIISQDRQTTDKNTS